MLFISGNACRDRCNAGHDGAGIRSAVAVSWRTGSLISDYCSLPDGSYIWFNLSVWRWTITAKNCNLSCWITAPTDNTLSASAGVVIYFHEVFHHYLQLPLPISLFLQQDHMPWYKGCISIHFWISVIKNTIVKIIITKRNGKNIHTQAISFFSRCHPVLFLYRVFAGYVFSSEKVKRTFGRSAYKWSWEVGAMVLKQVIPCACPRLHFPHWPQNPRFPVFDCFCEYCQSG